MFRAADCNRPHGDEWRWRLGPTRNAPSISVIVTSLTPADPAGNSRPFGFARELADEPIEPLVWEGD